MQSCIDLIIPAHNEEANITAVLAAVPRHYFRQIIVVDNASTDGTARLAIEAGATVVHEPRRGYGAACLGGLAAVPGVPGAPGVVAFLDADLADDPALLPKICEPIINGEADMVIGARPRLAQPGALTFTQRFGNQLACRLIALCTGHRYSDLGPMRAVRWSSLQRLRMADTTWGWTVEMQFKAAQLNLRTLDIDVPYRKRHAGKSKISGTLSGSIRAGWKILWTIFKLWATAR